MFRHIGLGAERGSTNIRMLPRCDDHDAGWNQKAPVGPSHPRAGSRSMRSEARRSQGFNADLHGPGAIRADNLRRTLSPMSPEQLLARAPPRKPSSTAG